MKPVLCPYCQGKTVSSKTISLFYYCFSCNAASYMSEPDKKEIFCTTFLVLFNDKEFDVEYYPDGDETWILNRSNNKNMRLEGKPITPQNAKTRLPMLLIFS